MSVSAKNTFVSDLEDVIGEYLTGAHTKRVVSDVKDELNDYTMERISQDYNPQNDDIVQAYLNAKEIEGKSRETINRYRREIYKLCSYAEKPVCRITTEDVRDYLASEQLRGLSGHTLEGVRQCISAFFNWVWREGYIQRNPMGNIGAIKYKVELKIPFTALELERLRQSCRTSRDMALVMFFLTTGCRVDEVHKMDIDSVSFTDLEVKVLGKGNKERIVYLTPVSAMMLQKYLADRADDNDALFVGRKGRLTTQGLRCILKKLEDRSGVVNVHPHRFRRTLATMLIDRGMSIQDVAKILGHSNINTTLGYIYSDKINIKHSYHQCIG